MKHAVHDEWLSMLKFQWPLVVLFVVGLLVLVFVTRPFAPTRLKLATGQANSSLDALGKKYAEEFKRHGVTLDLVNTAGAFENIELLKKLKVDAAFSLGGTVEASEVPEIVTLGSVEYQPFWLFYRGSAYDGINPSKFFAKKYFSVNIPGSGTRHLTEKLLNLHGIKIEGNQHMLSMPSGDSADALLAGKIDGVFLVAGIESKTIQRIVKSPDIKIFNFSMAEAYARRLKFLEIVNLPRGSIELTDDVPIENIQLVETTTTLIAEDDLHPAIQHLFLSTARKFNDAGQGFFRRTGGFPALIEQGLPTSSVAERYYSKGAPALEGYLPFWLSSLFDRIWFILFAAFAIGYPLSQLFPNYRLVYANLCMADCYDKLRAVDQKLIGTATFADLEANRAEFLELEERINQLWISNGHNGDFFNIKNAVEIVRGRVQRLAEQFKASPA